MYYIFETGNKSYKLKLTTRATVALEKKIGCNPLSIFGEGDTVPTVTTMVYVLHASLQQYNHNITLEEAFNIFDEWLESGKVVTDFIPVIIEIYKASGIIKTEKDKAEDEENNGNF